MPDRTQIAGMALQGLLADPNRAISDPDDLADAAVRHADALLARLGLSAAIDPDAPASPTLRDLGLSGRACAPLERMGVETLAQLAVQSRSDIAAVKGVSVDSMKVMDRLLKENGLGWDWTTAKPDPAPEPEADDETEDDGLEDVL